MTLNGDEIFLEVETNWLKETQISGENWIYIKKLPKGLTENGIYNLFLSIGNPCRVIYNSFKNTADILFQTYKEAELAVRDLNDKPPYYLTVTLQIRKPKIHMNSNSNFSNQVDALSYFNSNYSIPSNESTSRTDKEERTKAEINFLNEKETEVENDNCFKEEDQKVGGDRFFKVEKIETETPKCFVENNSLSYFKNVEFDASYKMFQAKYDFNFGPEKCVSFGRGYICLGEKDKLLGGLQNFTYSSENCEGDLEGSATCLHCKALTIRCCGKCLSPYCSFICLKTHVSTCGGEKSRVVSKYCESFPRSCNSENFDDHIIDVSPCEVVLSTYLTFKTVFVRRVDGLWEEKFFRLCNDVAAAAVLDAQQLERVPSVGTYCIAKFYENCCYYRAQVTNINNGDIEVFFLDFGNFQKTKLEDLKTLPYNLMEIPGLAVRVDLLNIEVGTSREAIIYYNKLTAEQSLLTLKFEDSPGNGVILVEEDTLEVVNEKVNRLILPSWKIDNLAMSKLGEILYFESLEKEELIVGTNVDLVFLYFDENEFLEHGAFWMANPNTYNYKYFKNELQAKILEYCLYLKNDCYLPRERELCLALYNGTENQV